VTILVETPPSFSKERDYILGVVLSEWLGLHWRRVDVSRSGVRILLAGSGGGEIRLPDVLFTVPKVTWLTKTSMPAIPLSAWNIADRGLNLRVIDTKLPLIYGEPSLDASVQDRIITLPIDIFGSAFFMLTRYEEVVRKERDAYDRFPAAVSLAYQEGFLKRPIIDEYVEVLWASMQHLWPQLRRKPRQFELKVSHDVDSPSRFGFCNPRSFVRRMGGDILKRGAFKNACLAPWIALNTRKALHPLDPYNTFNWLMDQSEKFGLTSAFYFMCGRTDPFRDTDYEPEHPAIRGLMRRIYHRGHEIGLHPSFNTYQNPNSIATEAARLKRICAEEGIKQHEWGGRMHYFRWETPTTLYGWQQAGMTYDSTLGYADCPGFRCGTCQEYPAFDPVAGEVLKLRIRPLIVMECSVIAESYLGLGTTSKAFEMILQLKNACRKVNGNFTLLWHNSQLTAAQERELYSAVITA
jgi:hypothetical protein